MITAEDFVLEIDSNEESNSFKLGTVTDLFENNTAKIQFDGEETPSEKQYAYLSSYAPTIGDRVLLGVLGGTYIILGKVNYNISPPTEEEIDRYLFDLKRVIMQVGLSVNGDTDITGSLNVTGDVTTNDITVQGNLNIPGSLSIPGDLGASSASVATMTATSSATVGSSYMWTDRIYSPSVRGGTVTCSTFNHDGTSLSFFNGSAATKKTVSRISSPSTVSTSDVATRLNALLTALDSYGLIND